MIELTSKQRKILEKHAQPLKPLAQIGKERFNEEQAAQIKRLLDEHELVKVRYIIVRNKADDETAGGLKGELDKLIEQYTSSTHVRTIGNVAVFYKPAKEEKDRKFEKELSKA